MILYLIGDAKSAKVNSWLALTPYKEEAEKFLEETPEAVLIKEVNVPPKLRRRRKKS